MIASMRPMPVDLLRHIVMHSQRRKAERLLAQGLPLG
jgi:hypothetical protein